jgi:hypothetical protein
MSKKFTLFLAALVGIAGVGLTSVAFADDWADDIRDAEILEAMPGPPICTSINSATDVDFAFILINPGDQAYMRVQPDPGLDILINFWNPSNLSAPVFTRDLTANANVFSDGGDGFTEWEVLANTSGQPDSGYYVSFEPSPNGPTVTSPIQYCIEFEIMSIDMDRPWTILSARENFRVGENFSIEVAYVNSRDRETNHDWYLVLEYLGTYTWYGVMGSEPTWTDQMVNMAGQAMPENGGFFLNTPLAFPVPPELAGLGGFTFYAASQDTQTGTFSNIPWHPVNFLP